MGKGRRNEVQGPHGVFPSGLLFGFCGKGFRAATLNS